jgi:hypothetical protein
MAAGRILLRKTLAERYPTTTPNSWTVDRDPDGAPWVRHPDIGYPPEVSMTHTSGMVCVSLSDSVCGIDVEHQERPVSSDRLVQRFFPQREVEELSAMSGSELHHEFILRWTVREAWAKAERSSFLDALGVCETRRDDRGSLNLLVARTVRRRTGRLFGTTADGFIITAYAAEDEDCEDLQPVGIVRVAD